MHAWSTRIRGDARPPSWLAIGLALLVIVTTCANGWAVPRSATCGTGDGEAVRAPGLEPSLDQDDEIETDDPDDPLVAPPGDAHGVIAPPIRRVIAVAYRAAGLADDPARSWTRRARLAGLVPWVSVRTGRNTSWADDSTSAIDHSTALEARATWRLDRLVFDGHELQVASIDAARRRDRRRLAHRVIRSYFTFLRAAAAARLQPRWTAHADEAAAELDALTDAWFSDELARLRRTASETRTF